MPSTPLTPTDPLNGAVYWLLVTMGVGGLALCVLLPESRELQRLAAAEQAHVRSLNAIRQNLEREERLLEALQGDPAVLARLARRELNYRSPYDRFVTLAAEESAPLVVPEDEPGVSPPRIPARLRLRRHAPPRGNPQRHRVPVHRPARDVRGPLLAPARCPLGRVTDDRSKRVAPDRRLRDMGHPRKKEGPAVCGPFS
jgi:hypothetical protein